MIIRKDVFLGDFDFWGGADRENEEEKEWLKVYETYDLISLPPVNLKQKSFYNKARLLKYHNGKTVSLQSYNTVVCQIKDNAFFVKLWSGYSATTLRHINSFLAYMGEDIRLSKSQWLRLDADKPYFIDDLRSKYFKAGF